MYIFFCNQTLSQNILWGVLHIIKYSSNTILMVLRKSIIWLTIFYLTYPSEVKWKSFNHVRLFATPWTIWSMEFSGQNTGVGSLFLLQGIFPTQGLKPGLPHCRQILYQLSHKGSPIYPSMLTLLTTDVYVHISWLRVNPWIWNIWIK